MICVRNIPHCTHFELVETQLKPNKKVSMGFKGYLEKQEGSYRSKVSGGYWEISTSRTSHQNQQETFPGCGTAPLTSNRAIPWDYVPVLKHFI